MLKKINIKNIILIIIPFVILAIVILLIINLLNKDTYLSKNELTDSLSSESGCFHIKWKKINKTVISAGLTPEIRLAIPIFSGFIRFSFCCASIRRPLISV